MGREKRREFEHKIDSFLATHCPRWASTPKKSRKSELEEMLRAAKTFDMATEIDYAVFCQLLVQAVFEPNTDFSSPSADIDVRKIMTSKNEPSEKLFELEEFFEQNRRERG